MAVSQKRGSLSSNTFTILIRKAFSRKGPLWRSSLFLTSSPFPRFGASHHRASQPQDAWHRALYLGGWPQLRGRIRERPEGWRGPRVEDWGTLEVGVLDGFWKKTPPKDTSWQCSKRTTTCSHKKRPVCSLSRCF